MSDDVHEQRFLFIGESDADSAKSRLAVAKIPYVKKKLESSRANWLKIIEIAQEPLLGVLVKLSARVMRSIAHVKDRDHLVDELFGRISVLPHTIFIHDSFNETDPPPPPAGDDEDQWFGSSDYFEPLDPAHSEIIRNMIEQFELNVVFYRRNVELSILAGEFIDQHQKNMLFRFYVPSQKIWATETSAILHLFKDYLNNAAGISVTQTTHSTASGTIYEFYGAHEVVAEQVSEQFGKFTQLMDLCVTDPDGAEKMLVEMGSDQRGVGEIVTRYSKQARRLSVDMRQEREQKILRIRHRMENELVEKVPSGDFGQILRLIDHVLPDQRSFAPVLGMGVLPFAAAADRNVTINIRPQIIEQVHGIVAQEVSGTTNLGVQPMQILELIEALGGTRTNELRSALYEMEDAGTSPSAKLSAGAKLRTFLAKATTKVGEKLVDASVAVLQAYVQKACGL
ncbi:hypothetical protein [Sphingomonas sp. Leaf38]|uniref:hypothetical protein n=1 Tax=Sphingomonas sp. Leaf38 TaxID=1736217 RepID=UPI0006FEF3F7|nr:hypothetical protein [Sphingomonas sp. Leaf38]KQN33128.1 hypothetical protein ASE88_04185 [Sphingomonas sp. Leaf38]